jgi:cellulose biosynthesis protein BcsQ
MKSIFIANSKGGCGSTSLSYLMSAYYNLDCITNTQPMMDFRSLTVFSSSASRIPKNLLKSENAIYDLRGSDVKLQSLLNDLASVVSHFIIPTATDAVSLSHTVNLANHAQALGLPVSIVINNYRTEKNLSTAHTSLRDLLPHTPIFSLRYTTLFGRLTYDGRAWLEKVHHSKGEGRLLNTLHQIHGMFDQILNFTEGSQHAK